MAKKYSYENIKEDFRITKKKQKFTKKTILRTIKGKTVDQAIENLKELSKNGFGSCKIEIESKLSFGPDSFNRDEHGIQDLDLEIKKI